MDDYRFKIPSPLLKGSLVLFLLAGCASNSPPKAPPTDTQLTNASQAGRLAYSQSLYQLAANQYNQALQRARTMDDPEAIGTQAFNRAIALIALEELDQAGDLLKESEKALNRAGLPLADVLLVQAHLLQHQAHQGNRQALGLLDAAIQRVLQDPRSHPQNQHKAQAALLQAEVACERSEATASAQYLAVARTLTVNQPNLTAGLARAAGCLSLLQNNPADAAHRFDEEAELMRRNRRYRDMSKALRRSGDAYRRAGLNDLAAERYYRAARSWLGQSEKAKAKQDIQKAASLVKDSSTKTLIAQLKKEIELE